jgi:hypothetical protein
MLESGANPESSIFRTQRGDAHRIDPGEGGRKKNKKRHLRLFYILREHRSDEILLYSAICLMHVSIGDGPHAMG